MSEVTESNERGNREAQTTAEDINQVTTDTQLANGCQHIPAAESHDVTVAETADKSKEAQDENGGVCNGVSERPTSSVPAAVPTDADSGEQQAACNVSNMTINDSPTDEKRQHRRSESAAASDAMEEEAVAKTTKTEKMPNGGRTTTTTTTTTHKTKDGQHVVTRQTKQITRVGGIGTTDYVIKRTPADQIVNNLAKTFQCKAVPGLSGTIIVRTETWNSNDGVIVRTQKSQPLAAPGQPDSGVHVSGMTTPSSASVYSSNHPPTFSPSPDRVGVQRSATSIKQVLLDWCKSKVNHYENVNVTNFSSSWSDGLAFCALIHNFHPEAFDFSQLNARNRRQNFQIAFDAAEKYANIAPLLDVDDMVSLKNPDWKCVFTYLQSFYRRFANPTKPRPQPPCHSPADSSPVSIVNSRQ